MYYPSMKRILVESVSSDRQKFKIVSSTGSAEGDSVGVKLGSPRE